MVDIGPKMSILKQSLQHKILTWTWNMNSNSWKLKFYFLADRSSSKRYFWGFQTVKGFFRGGRGGIFVKQCGQFLCFCSVPCHFSLNTTLGAKFLPQCSDSVLYRSNTSPFPSCSLHCFARSCTQAVCISGIRWTSTALWCITRCTWAAHLGETCTTMDSR